MWATSPTLATVPTLPTLRGVMGSRRLRAAGLPAVQRRGRCNQRLFECSSGGRGPPSPRRPRSRSPGLRRGTGARPVDPKGGAGRPHSLRASRASAALVASLAAATPRQAGYHLLLAQVAVALSLLCMRVGIAHLGPEVFLGTKALMSLPLVVALGLSTTKSRSELVDAGGAVRHVGYLALLGLVGVFAEGLFTAHGIARAGLTKLVVIGQLAPVYTTVVSVFMGREVATLPKVAALSCGVLGAMVMLDPTQLSLASPGNILFLLRTLCFAAMLVLQGPILKRLSPLTVTVAAHGVGDGLLIAATLPYLLGELPRLGTQPLVAWASVLGVAGFTAAAHALTSAAGTHKEAPTEVAAYSFVQPVVMGGICMVLFGETLCAREVCGVVLVLLGTLATAVMAQQERLDADGDATGGLACGTAGCQVIYDDGTLVSPDAAAAVRVVGRRLGPWWALVWAAVVSAVTLAGAGGVMWGLIYLYWQFL